MSNFIIIIRMCFFILIICKEIVKASDGCLEFGKKCKSGECIPCEFFCDGKPDCYDSSDEIAENCIHLRCPQFAYRCAYGACINIQLKCNGIRDCADNSDESAALCEKDDQIYKHGHCTKDEYQCRSGQCVRLVEACDGKIDCYDGSDETIELCAGRYCPSFAFRCGYGACINGKAKCNGTQECMDGSDEFPLLCEHFTNEESLLSDVNKSTTTATTITTTTMTTTRPTTPKTTTTTTEVSKHNCIVETHPELISILDDTNETLHSGYVVKEFQAITYKCLSRHVLEGPHKNYCLGGQWVTPHPNCTKYCTSRVIQGTTFTAVCRYNNVTIPCDDHIKSGTIAHISCTHGYKKPNRVIQKYLFCNEFGEWDFSPYRCEPECGMITNIDNLPIDVRMSKTNITNTPWHALIYSKLNGNFQEICGGTIINAKLIISSKHCFWNKREKRTNDPASYSVAVGKYFRDYSAKESLEPQFFDVTEIKIPRSHIDGPNTNSNDIALLVLDKYIEFNSYIKPICIEWLKHNEIIMHSSRIGHVASSGKTGAGQTISKEIHLNEFETLSNNDCRQNVTRRLRNKITADKFCVLSTIGNNLCNNDIGSGFVIPRITDEGVQKYFLWGVFNNERKNNDQCNPDSFSAFTNIQYYAAIIQENELKYKPR